MKSEHLKWVLNPWLMIIALAAAAVYINQEQLFGGAEPEVLEETIEETIEPVQPEPEPEPAPEPEADTVTLQEQMDVARQAAKQGDFTAAVAAYRLAAELDPDGYLAVGELGNLYYSRGNMQEAAEAYLQAALALKTAGHVEAIWPMLPVIEQQLPQQGYTLRRELLGGPQPATP